MELSVGMLLYGVTPSKWHAPKIQEVDKNLFSSRSFISERSESSLGRWIEQFVLPHKALCGMYRYMMCVRGF